MSTIPSTDELIRAVDQLPPDKLDTILRHVLTIRARRQARFLPAEETALVQRINRGLPSEQWERYQAWHSFA